jgi:hypothetical protein
MMRLIRTAGIAGAAMLVVAACQDLPMSQAEEKEAVEVVQADEAAAASGLMEGTAFGATTVCTAYTQVLEQLRAAAADGGDPAHVEAFEILVLDACN